MEGSGDAHSWASPLCMSGAKLLELAANLFAPAQVRLVLPDRPHERLL
jgi:hypothetical protein